VTPIKEKKIPDAVLRSATVVLETVWQAFRNGLRRLRTVGRNSAPAESSPPFLLGGRHAPTNRNVLTLIVGYAALAATPAHAWNNRPGVLRAAETLAAEVERLDTALHTINAPQSRHRQNASTSKETVTEFATEVRQGASYQHAYGEMQHIRQDVALIRDELALYPYLLQNPTVEIEWRHTPHCLPQSGSPDVLGHSRSV
jgi:hypothetical protein